MVERIHHVEQHRSALPGVDAITLFSEHVFPRHSHDQFGIGLMTSGAQSSWSAIGQVESTAGDVIMVNPGEIHDGMPLRGGARGWRMLYFDHAVVTSELTDEILSEPEIARPAVCDPPLAGLFVELFSQVTDGVPEPLAIEETLLLSLMHVVKHHSVRRPGGGVRSPPSIPRRLSDFTLRRRRQLRFPNSLPCRA